MRRHSRLRSSVTDEEWEIHRQKHHWRNGVRVGVGMFWAAQTYYTITDIDGDNEMRVALLLIPLLMCFIAHRVLNNSIENDHDNYFAEENKSE